MYSGGSGTELDPYLIATAQDLDDVRNNLDAYFLQTVDIDLSEYVSWVSIDDFEGVYDGDSHTISNLTLNEPTLPAQGLFGYIGAPCTIKNLILTDANIIADYHSGILVGYLSSPSVIIQNITVENSSLEGDHNLGLIVGSIGSGNPNDIKLSECKALNSSIIGRYIIGGITSTLFGSASSLLSESCVIGCTFKHTYAYTTGGAGFITGKAKSMEIRNCYVLDNVFIDSVGLLAHICPYSAEAVGEDGTQNVYAANDADVDFYGTGYLGSSFKNCIVDTDRSDVEVNPGITGRTTIEMKTLGPYRDYNFGEIWYQTASINDGYPSLQWENEMTESNPVYEKMPLFIRTEALTLQPGALVHLAHLTLNYKSEEPVYMAIEYRYNRQTTFRTTAFQKVHEENGAVYFGVTALEFRILISCASAENFKPYSLSASFKVVDKRAIRGIYVQ